MMDRIQTVSIKIWMAFCNKIYPKAFLTNSYCRYNPEFPFLSGNIFPNGSTNNPLIQGIQNVDYISDIVLAWLVTAFCN